MPEFEDSRSQLSEARLQKEQSQKELFAAREQAKQLQGRLERLNRILDPSSEEHQKLHTELAQLQAVIRRQEAAHKRFLDIENEIWERFVALSDPRRQVTSFNDQTPFLLFPVRLETRFKTVQVPGAIQHQLWVRIYPDGCAVDSFEAELSEVEVRSGQTYWVEVWKAGGIEDQERGAWRGLVSSHGSGRAAWIKQQYQPRNPAQKPVKDQADDVILVMASVVQLNPVEQAAAETFWKVVWLAGGDQSKISVAKANLVGATGAERADEIEQQYRPVNFATPVTASVTVSVAFLHLPDRKAQKQRSWSQAPKTWVMPDRFVLLGYSGGNKVLEQLGNPVPSPLQVGPDPSASGDQQLQAKDGELQLPEELKWMVDFDRAVEQGVGFRVNLSEAQARQGFDRLLVLGLRLSADAAEAQKMLEDLFEHHHYSRTGLSLLPQGTPTNNTEKNGAGFSRTEDADASFEDLNKDSLFVATENWLLKQDGQWLAETLGIRPEVLKQVRHSEGTDQSEARAANIALWPATLGYWMESMMHPVFDSVHQEHLHWFFTRFVTGRGAIPAVRIGSQPYGILPTTVFSRMRWMQSEQPPMLPDQPKGMDQFLRRFYGVLRGMDQNWEQIAEQVSYVGKQGNLDAHKVLLDVLGLHPGSVEYHQRYAESLEHLYNRYNLQGFGVAFMDSIGAHIGSGMELLGKLGYSGQSPEILNKLFTGSQNLLTGPVVDDRPLSEIEPIRSYTPDGRNYIQWLMDAARTSLDALRLQRGFSEDKAPSALLYIYLRHALILGYWDTHLRLYQDFGLLEPAILKSLQREPAFIHIQAQGQARVSESRWKQLYEPQPRITNDSKTLLADHITKVIGKSPAARYLDEQLSALERLKHVPTARLERVFAEHIDCCSYRLDAWQLGFVQYQLATMRSVFAEEGIQTRPGVYLGAYGWLEDVRSENKVLSPVRLTPQQLEDLKLDGSPVYKDSTNEGYIHAPSLNHAVTAAVLRNGYLSNATPSNPQTLAVNLSSERVRIALSMIEGIRKGQSLGALLGYQLERGLHDRHTLAEVDRFIYTLRKAFPLRATRISTTTEGTETEPIEALEARNVVDGYALVQQIKTSGVQIYPFGRPDLPTSGAAAPNLSQRDVINKEVDRILDIHDALADVAIAEGVHQVAQGNYDRAAATLDAYSKASFPPIPDVVQTPRSGITLTQRVGIQLETGLNSNASPVAGIRVTPRSQAEPALNKWLSTVLSDPSDVGCLVKIEDAATPITVTQADLQLQPIDLFYLLHRENQQAMSELDDRVVRFIRQSQNPRPDQAITIQYLEPVPGLVSFFELSPLVHSLRSMVLRSRPLKANDVVLHNEAIRSQEEDVFVDRGRIASVLGDMQTLHTDLSNFVNLLEPLLADPTNPANNVQILAQVDTWMNDLAALLERASRFGIPQTGWGFVYDWQRREFEELLAKSKEVEERWQDRVVRFDNLIAQHDALPITATDQEKFDLLLRAELLISTRTTTPLPAAPGDLRTILLGKRTLFDTKLSQFRDIQDTTTQIVSGLRTELLNLLPVSDFDLIGLDLADFDKSIVVFASDVLRVATGLRNDLLDPSNPGGSTRRLRAAIDKLQVHDSATKASDKAKALQEAAKILLGEDFLLVPEFGLTSEQAIEWERCMADSRVDGLMRHQTQTLKNDFPVDDWLYGVARVREKLHHYEQILLLCGAMGTTEPTLAPIQLPYKADDHWLALEYPEDYRIDGDRLLYTAHYAQPFDKSKRQCGLLLDEWTELIPGKEETTGLTFHYDRPSTEPPQTMLLVTPPEFRGGWQWQDLVDALGETLDMAKKRAVEPAQVDQTPYARFLPATLMAVTLYQISISANLALNNRVYEVIRDGN